MLTLILFTCVLYILFIYYFNLRKRYQYFERQQIPTPSYGQFFFGHLKQLWQTKSGYSRQLQEWTRQLGSIYGFYEGSTPVYVVSNVDFLHEVFVKQFSNFHARKSSIQTHLIKAKHLVESHGSNWKRQRQIINPTFTSLKLKTMSPLIDNSIEELVKKLNTDKLFNIYLLYKRLTMDVICRCAFGIDTNMQDDPDNIYLHKIGQIISTDFEKLHLSKLCRVIPKLSWIFAQIFLFRNNFNRLMNFICGHLMKFEELPNLWLFNRIQNVIDMRSTNIEQRRIDLLQLMLDASAEGKEKLSYEEVKSNVFLFLLAGYETTATALAYCTYVLAKYQNIQGKLQMEIDAENDEYLDLFIKEVLRMYPIPIQTINRRCMIDEASVCGYKIHQGSIIQADIYSIHYDPILWGPHPTNEFYPERHLEQRHPMAYLAFGQGPRNCIGMRFALLEIKLVLRRLLKEYTIVQINEEIFYPIRETAVIRPNEIQIQLRKR